MLSREAADTNSIVFGLNHMGLEFTIYYTRGKHTHRWGSNPQSITLVANTPTAGARIHNLLHSWQTHPPLMQFRSWRNRKTDVFTSKYLSNLIYDIQPVSLSEILPWVGHI